MSIDYERVRFYLLPTQDFLLNFCRIIKSRFFCIVLFLLFSRQAFLIHAEPKCRYNVLSYMPMVWSGLV